jgi:hypothetical protein
MGMFDSLYVDCPGCGAENSIEFQSKSGPRMMGIYHRRNIPTNVAFGINGTISQCKACTGYFKIRFTLPIVPKSVIVKISKKSYDTQQRSSEL